MIPGSAMFLSVTLGPVPADEPNADPTAAADQPLTAGQKGARTLAAHRSAAADERRRRLQEEEEERERAIADQIASGRLIIRQAEGAELDRLRQDRDRRLEELRAQELVGGPAVKTATPRTRACLECGGVFEPTAAWQKCCSDEHAAAAKERERHRDRLAAEFGPVAAAPPQNRAPAPTPPAEAKPATAPGASKECAMCGGTFIAKNPKAIYCSKLCNRRASRARQAAA